MGQRRTPKEMCPINSKGNVFCQIIQKVRPFRECLTCENVFGVVYRFGEPMYVNCKNDALLLE